jgi:hypothetical protein
MKVLSIGILFTWILLNAVFADSFKSFEYYQFNESELANDITRLETLIGTDKIPNNVRLYEDTLIKFKSLKESVNLLNSRLSLEKFFKDVQDNGWKQTAVRVQSLIKICEQRAIDIAICTTGIDNLVSFIQESNLKHDDKESIVTFLSNYRNEIIQVSEFSPEYIIGFNSSITKLNAISVPLVNKAPMVIKVVPVSKKVNIISVPRNYIDSKNLLFLIPLVLIAVMVFQYRKIRVKSTIKKFYTLVFAVCRRSKIKVRLFGNIDKSGLEVLSKIESKYLDLIGHSNTFASEISIYFKTKKNLFNVETLFSTKRSYLAFIEKAGFDLQENFEHLKQIIDDNDGEIVYTTNYDLNGNITNSKFIIQIPI